MFTRGYCFQFAKALYTAFKDKYHCAILGTGYFQMTDDDDIFNYRISAIEKAINAVDFNHFVCLISTDLELDNHLVADIHGVYTIDDSDMTFIECMDEESKARLRYVLESKDKERFDFLYSPTCNKSFDEYYKVLWKLNEGEIKFKEQWFKERFNNSLIKG